MGNEHIETLICDGTNLWYRAYWTAKNNPGRNDWDHILIFLTALKSYVELFSPSKIIVCWDHREGDVNYRKDLDENYKAQRVKTDDIFDYIPVLHHILDSLGITQINPKTLEADDIIFWLAAVKFPNESAIISTDSDIYQLIMPELSGNIIYHPQKKREITPLFLKDMYDVNNGFEYIIQKAFRGDIADNLVGVKGIRRTRISKIINILSQDFDLSTLVPAGLLNEDELKIFKHNLKMMKFDMNILSEDEINWYEECISNTKEGNKEEFITLIKELELWSIYGKIDYWFKTFTNRIKNTGGLIFDGVFEYLNKKYYDEKE